MNKSNTAAINEHTVTIQSCWLDCDLDIQANVGIKLHESWRYYHIQISAAKTLSYPHWVPKPTMGRQLTFEEFDDFLKANFATVLTLIMNLLEPDELAVLALAKGSNPPRGSGPFYRKTASQRNRLTDHSPF